MSRKKLKTVRLSKGAMTRSLGGREMKELGIVAHPEARIKRQFLESVGVYKTLRQMRRGRKKLRGGIRVKAS